MIPEYKLYHGAVLADIVDRSEAVVGIGERAEAGRLLNYILNESIGIQIKYSTARLRPWSFTFLGSHIDQIRELFTIFPVSFVVLVCRTDGFACIPAPDALNALVRDKSENSWLRVDRQKRGMYRVFGPKGELDGRLKTTSEPIVEALRSTMRDTD